MLLEHEGDIIRELRFDEGLCKVGGNPQAWQFKEVYDAATLGFELIWPYENCKVNKKLDNLSVEHRIMSKDLFAINFPSHIRVKESYNLFIFPHHTSFFAMSSWSTHEVPIAIPQIIEADWWPGTLQVIFVRRKATFEKGLPIAQGLVIPKRDMTLKTMDERTKKEVKQSWEFIQGHKEEYITRQMQVKGFDEQDYARLSQINQSNKLPPQIKRKKTEPNLRLLWK